MQPCMGSLACIMMYIGAGKYGMIYKLLAPPLTSCNLLALPHISCKLLAPPHTSCNLFALSHTS